MRRWGIMLSAGLAAAVFGAVSPASAEAETRRLRRFIEGDRIVAVWEWQQPGHRPRRARLELEHAAWERYRRGVADEEARERECVNRLLQGQSIRTPEGVVTLHTDTEGHVVLQHHGGVGIWSRLRHWVTGAVTGENLARARHRAALAQCAPYRFSQNGEQFISYRRILQQEYAVLRSSGVLSRFHDAIGEGPPRAKVDAALAFAQGRPYRIPGDEVRWGISRPVEILFAPEIPSVDCDSAAMTTALLSCSLGVGTSLVRVPQHVFAAFEVQRHPRDVVIPRRGAPPLVAAEPVSGQSRRLGVISDEDVQYLRQRRYTRHDICRSR